MDINYFDFFAGILLLIFTIINLFSYKHNIMIIRDRRKLQGQEKEDLKGQKLFAYREMFFIYGGSIATIIYLLKGFNII